MNAHNSPESMWTNLQDLIPKAAGKYNFTSTLKSIEICQEYRKIAQKLLPKEALKSSFPKSFKNQILTIGTINSVWADQINRNKHRIHQSLQKKFGEKTIQKIRIQMCEEMPREY